MELILGLGIMAAMGGSVYLVYANAVQIDVRSRMRGDLSFESYMIFRSIEEDLGRFVNYRYKINKDNEERLALSGEGNTLSFIRESPDGLQWVSYELNEPQEGVIRKTQMGRRSAKNSDQTLVLERSDIQVRQLVRKNALFKGLPLQHEEVMQIQTVSSSITDAGLKFYYADNIDKVGLTWLDQWHQLDSPAVIRVVLSLWQGASGGKAEFSRDFLLPVGI